jgi:phage regulator Rha-like protein
MIIIICTNKPSFPYNSLWFKRAVRRNIDRFPDEFMFELTQKEHSSLRYQFGILKRGQHSKYPHFAFTEHGIAMLSSVLRSKKAIQVNIGIIKVFTAMKQFVMNYKELQKKMEELEKKYDKKFEYIYEALNYLLSPPNPPRKKIGYKRYDEE